MIALNLQAEKESEMTLSLYTFLEYKFLKEAEQEADRESKVTPSEWNVSNLT